MLCRSTVRPVGLSGLSRPDRRDARISCGGHRGHRLGGVEIAWSGRRSAATGGTGALLQALGRGQDPAQRAQRDVPDRGQAVVDLPGLLAHDEQLVLAQQSVDLVDAAGRRVLDGQDGEIHLAREQRRGHLAQRPVPHRFARRSLGGQVLARRRVAERVGRALEGHPQLTRARPVEAAALLGDGLADQLAEDSAPGWPRPPARWPRPRPRPAPSAHGRHPGSPTCRAPSGGRSR